MVRFLIAKFIPNHEDIKNRTVRERYSVLSGALGILCNALLFIVKIVIGVVMNSIAILSDAFNNLSDMGSSLISIISAKLSNKRSDKQHPFGHGRLEYIASFAISFIIMIVGFELGRSSIEKIISPEPVNFSLPSVVILAVSVLVKVWMYFYNRYIGRLIGSSVLLATAKDSLNDVISSSAVILSAIIGVFVSFPVDGIIGLLVSIWIFYGGIGIARETINVLLGSPASKDLIADIKSIVLQGKGIVGVHDLIVHDYGPGRVMASLHAEVPDDADMIETHEIIDEIETKIKAELGVEAVIHMDPVAKNDSAVEALREETVALVQGLDSRLTLHDFRVVRGEARVNLIFDLVVPYSYTPEQTDSLRKQIGQKLKERDRRFHAVIQIDHLYY